MLDTSASMDSKWQNVLRFATTLVEGYNIGVKKTKVSIGLFGGGTQQIIMGFNSLRGNVIFCKFAFFICWLFSVFFIYLSYFYIPFVYYLPCNYLQTGTKRKLIN